MSRRKSWRPKVAAEPEFNPFGNIDRSKDSVLYSPQIRDAREDTAPLEGSKDLSDDDSLEDVIAEQYSEESSKQPSAGAGATTK